MNKKNGSKIVVALDTKDIHQAATLARKLRGYTEHFKIGLELMHSVGGPQAVRYLNSYGINKIFYDCKLHDVPATIAKTVKGISEMGVAMFSIYASCGVKAMSAAVENKGSTLVLAVTELTSVEEDKVIDQDRIFNLAHDAKKAGCDGIICAATDLAWLNRYRDFDNLLKVTPGIRPYWYSSKDDHERYATPREAVEFGSDFLVIGRPITKYPSAIGSPEKAISLIIDEIKHDF